MKAVVAVSCSRCQKVFDRAKKEVARSEKLGRPMFCSRSCLAFHTNRKPRTGTLRNVNFFRPSEPDEFAGLRKFIRSAKNRGRMGDLDLPYLKELWDGQHGLCAVSGIEMRLRRWAETGQAHPFQASLDRMDNSRPYERGNVRFVCAMANLARAEWSDEMLIAFCKGVAGKNP